MQKNIETKAIINSENRDNKNQIIYVKDFVLNFSSAFYNKKNNQESTIIKKEEPLSEQSPIEPDKKKESNLKTRKKLDKPKDLDESKDDDSDFNVFDYKKSDSNFIEEYKKSEIPYQKFIADIFEDNVTNNTELDKTLYNRAYFTHAFKNVTSLEQATELFHKICK